jgi:lipopolysaccharide export system protein LptA
MRVVIATLFALGAGPALAQAAATPVKITADTFTVDEATKQATFKGKVEILRGEMTMWAATVEVKYGAGGQSDIDSLEATGGVRIKSPGQEATGARAVFDPDTSVVRLSGNVKLVNTQGTMSGPELTIDLAKNTSVFKGSEGGRVTGVFTPQ